MMVKPHPPAPAHGSPPDERPAAPVAAACYRRWHSAELFRNEQQIEIVHGQSVYRLRLTSLGKLILTK